jgi:hypothetical protein
VTNDGLRPTDRGPAAAFSERRGWWRRPSSWVAITLLVVSLAMVGCSLTLLIAPGRPASTDSPSALNVVVVLFAVVMLPTVGAILAILRPGNPIGWLFIVCGLGFTLGIFSTEYVGWAIDPASGLPAAQLVDWMGTWTGTMALGLAIVFLPLLFPDGHPPGPRWRIFAWVAGVAFVVATVASAIQPSGTPLYGGRLPNPFGVSGPMGEIAGIVNQVPVMLVLGVLSIASLVLRFRGSRGIERQQLKWFLLSVGALLVTAIVGIATQVEAVWYGVMLAFAALPVSAGIAVLRYRLYEIDRIISRTIGYGVVTATLALVFVGAVLGLQAILAQFTGGNTVAVAASTLVVAALFQPLRRRIQSTVDRRFDRARYDGERTLATFAARLRDQVELEAIEAELDGVVRQTVAPTASWLWIDRPEVRE